MDFKETREMISAKVNEAEMQHSEMRNRMDTNRANKEQAEADKKAALAAKDETLYKDASRRIADAEAGEEFCEICLRDLRRKKYASEDENNAVMQGLQAEKDSIYVDAILKIEAALATITGTIDEVKQKYETIDSMYKVWHESIMRDFNPNAHSFCSDRLYSLAGFDGQLKGKLFNLREGKKANPLFKKGEP